MIMIRIRQRSGHVRSEEHDSNINCRSAARLEPILETAAADSVMAVDWMSVSSSSEAGDPATGSRGRREKQELDRRQGSGRQREFRVSAPSCFCSFFATRRADESVSLSLSQDAVLCIMCP